MNIDELINEAIRVKNEFAKINQHWDLEQCLDSVLEHNTVTEEVKVKAQEKVAQMRDNAIEKACEVAHNRLVAYYIEKGIPEDEVDEHISIDSGDEIFYTDEAQEIFDEFYDEELNKRI